MGYLGRDGESVFSIAIRTMVGRDGRATCGMGADSDPASGYDEIWAKAVGSCAALS